MGRPKALLPCRQSGESFVHRLAQALHEGGLDEVLVVGRVEDDALRAEVDGLPVPARYVENPSADGGQLTSVLAGLAVADRPGVTGLLVPPVAARLIAPATVAALIASFGTTHAPIVRAVHNGRHGHPVIFARAMFPELRHANLSIGARAVVRAHATKVVEVEVADPAVLGDVDTPDDYEAQIGLEL